jgi:hypothetical protein
MRCCCFDVFLLLSLLLHELGGGVGRAEQRIEKTQESVKRMAEFICTKASAGSPII